MGKVWRGHFPWLGAGCQSWAVSIISKSGRDLWGNRSKLIGDPAPCKITWGN